ncbi:MAG: glycerol-3-phosphate 1-O-acyltransferase PlsY [Alicyclobacillus sp.]|nr:glycerol-3-phosphate 1-O-acyltransferase PlsY [Alicyclobacillus sp.]
MLFLSLLVAYLIGSVSTSTLLTRWVAGKDIRQFGSGNAGATNTLRVLGLRYALVVLAADILKGMVAVWLSQALTHGSVWAVYLSALAVMVGHNWPVFFGFRGGKGIATAIGTLALLMFPAAALAGAIGIVLVMVTRYVSLGALSFTILTPICAWLLHEPLSAILFATAVMVLSIYRHRKNIQRLARGQEPKVFSRH